MKIDEIVQALRCVSTAGHEAGCESCPYYRAERIPEDMRATFGSDVLYSCDIDRVGLDGAALIEELTDRCARYAEEIAILQERTRWIPVTERRPEQDGQYICCYVFGEDGRVPFFQVLDYYATDVHPHFQHDKAYGMRVTHWMPLPDGPEVE